MTGPTDDRRQATPAAQTGSYSVALLPPALTTLPSLVDVVVPVRPPLSLLFAALLLLFAGAALGFSPWQPEPDRLFATGFLAALVYAGLSLVVLGPGTGSVAGSLAVLADVLLTWTAAYAVAALLVYGFGLTELVRRRLSATPDGRG